MRVPALASTLQQSEALAELAGVVHALLVELLAFGVPGPIPGASPAATSRIQEKALFLAKGEGVSVVPLDGGMHGTLESRISCLRDEVEHDFAKIRAECAQTRTDVEFLSSLDRRVADLAELLDEKVDIAEKGFREALVNLRMSDIRAHTDALERHKLAVGSIAQGLNRIAQVCGLLPGAPVSGSMDPITGRPVLSSMGSGADSLDTTFHLEMADVLAWELSGNSIARRVEIAWAHLAPGHGNMIDLMQKKAEQAAQKFVRAEVGDVGARMDRACQHFAFSQAGGGAAPVVGSGLEAARAGGARRQREATLAQQQQQQVTEESARGVASPPSAHAPLPRGLPARGRVLVAPTTPRAVEWTRASSALVPLAPGKPGRALAELRAAPELRDGAA